jgi:hypothetical protein
MTYDYKKQVSVDSLLGIHDRHDITCPKINVLQFNPRSSTKIYEEDLEQDPKDLKINLTELFTAMNDLDTWSNQVIKLVNSLPEDLYNAVLGEVLIYESDYGKLMDLIGTDYKSELREYASEINGLIEQWQEYRTELEEAKEEEFKHQKILEKEEKNLLFLTVKGEDTSESLALVEFYKDEVNEQKERKISAFDSFERYIKDDFKKQANEFSTFLETVRERNDDVRTQIGEIKYQISIKAKTFLKIMQPDEYLDVKFGIKPNVANLGVMFNDTITESRNEQVNFNSLLIAMKSKKFITFEQMNHIMDKKDTFEVSFREERKASIFDALKQNGFNTVRYYNDQREYTNDRNSFTEYQLNKPAQKPKII